MKVVYDEDRIPLEKLLDYYFLVIDPVSRRIIMHLQSEARGLKRLPSEGKSKVVTLTVVVK